MKVFDCEQNSDEWLQARLGIPTASEFHTVLAQGAWIKGTGKRDASVTRRKYMLKLLGERLTGQPLEAWKGNYATERGHAMEPEILALYRFLYSDVECRRVGFVLDEAARAGASPDMLVGHDGLVEAKSKEPHLLLESLLSGKAPTLYRTQIQGALWITEREWCDLVIYWPGLDPFIHRVYRDEKDITSIRLGVEMFNNELEELEAKLRAT